jgi:hypothetical protein
MTTNLTPNEPTTGDRDDVRALLDSMTDTMVAHRLATLYSRPRGTTLTRDAADLVNALTTSMQTTDYLRRQLLKILVEDE